MCYDDNKIIFKKKALNSFDAEKYIKKIFIFTDGSCKGNPGPGGWAAIFLEEKILAPFASIHGHAFDTTNNRMEMTAMIEALRFIKKNNFDRFHITLYSDSNLLVQTLRLGWKKKANLDLWKEFDEVLKGLDIQFVWVEGHAQNKWNNECDRLATSESKKAMMLLQKKQSGFNA